MRNEATIDAILRALRDLWLRNEAMSICGLVYAAVEPAVPNEEIRAFSDASLLRNLRAMIFFGSERADPGIVTVEHLAALDEARDYSAASSYNWLNAELGRLRQVVRAGGVVSVEEESGLVILAAEADFERWARSRYPFAKPADPTFVLDDLN